MSIRFGGSPIAWINDDMPEIGGDTPLETVLADARDIGFAGIELGGKFPRDPGALRALLDRFGLVLVGGWYSASLLARSGQEEIAALQDHLALLKAMDCEVFIQAETSNAVHSDRARSLSATPDLSPADWPEFGRRITEVTDYIQDQGLRFAYHHHHGTVVEDQRELDLFLEHTGPSAGLTLDTGHARLGGIDALDVIRSHPGRIAHVHCKDVRGSIFQDLRSRDGSFLDGVLEGMFTVPGDGDLDYSAVMRELHEIGYSGWIIIEAEQDPQVADPRHYGEIGLRSLRIEAEAAGFLEAVR